MQVVRAEPRGVEHLGGDDVQRVDVEQEIDFERSQLAGERRVAHRRRRAHRDLALGGEGAERGAKARRAGIAEHRGDAVTAACHQAKRSRSGGLLGDQRDGEL